MPELFDFVSFVNPFKGHMKLPFNPKIWSGLMFDLFYCLPLQSKIKTVSSGIKWKWAEGCFIWKTSLISQCLSKELSNAMLCKFFRQRVLKLFPAAVINVNIEIAKFTYNCAVPEACELVQYAND
jgi:hypothetical protein